MKAGITVTSRKQNDRKVFNGTETAVNLTAI